MHKKNVEKMQSVDQKEEARFAVIQAQVLAAKSLFAASGAIVAGWRNHRGRRTGPYYRLAFRTSGRQRPLYLGASEKLAQRVARLLAELQAAQRERRHLRRLRALLRDSLRREKARLEEMLAPLGFRMKGNAFHRRRNRVPATSDPSIPQKIFTKRLP